MEPLLLDGGCDVSLYGSDAIDCTGVACACKVDDVGSPDESSLGCRVEDGSNDDCPALGS